jgi:hypothetical protein
MPLTTKDTPPALPEWFMVSYTYLEEGLDVKEWKDCVKSWVNMEKGLGLSEVGSVRLIIDSLTKIPIDPPFQHRMNTKSRPGVLSKWLMNWKFHMLPEVDDVAGYAEEWLSWWNNVQPKWRQSTKEGSLPLPLSVAHNKEDITSLKKGGPSGLLTVMIGLKWWASIHDNDSRWLAVVNDIRMCMEELVEPGSKRSGGELEGGASKKRKMG